MTTKSTTLPTAAEVSKQIGATLNPRQTHAHEMQLALRAAQAQIAGDMPEPKLAALIETATTERRTPSAAEIVAAASADDARMALVRASNSIGSFVGQLSSSLARDPEAEEAAATLDYLAGVMEQINEYARSLPSDAPLTAEDAIAHEDGRELYFGVSNMIAVYKAVRAAQFKATRILANSDDDYNRRNVVHEALRLSGQIGDATDHEATWIERRRKQWQRYAAALENEEPEVRQYFEDTPSTPWKPANDRGFGWPEEVEDDETRARFILWVAKRSGFIVPTWDELYRSHLANEERTNALSWAKQSVKVVTDKRGRVKKVVRLRLGEVEVGRKVEPVWAAPVVRSGLCVSRRVPFRGCSGEHSRPG